MRLSKKGPPYIYATGSPLSTMHQAKLIDGAPLGWGDGPLCYIRTAATEKRVGLCRCIMAHRHVTLLEYRIKSYLVPFKRGTHETP